MRIEEMAFPGDVRVLGIEGELDAPEARQIAESLDALPPRETVVVDLRKVRFAGAAAIGSLVGARAKARRQSGDLVLSRPSAFLRKLLKTLGLDRTLRTFPGERDMVLNLPRDAVPGPTATERTFAAG